VTQEDDVTLDDIFGVLCEVREEVRQLSSRIAKLEERAQDLADEQDTASQKAADDAHQLYVLTSGRKCKCSVCEG
jgi:DNA repair exonuclease SbcCD ATPase subunit